MSKGWTAVEHLMGNGGEDTKNGQSKGGSLTRTVLVHITGNRVQWEHMGIHGALWKVNPERAGTIFGNEPAMPESADVLQEKLSRAMIRNVVVLESNTNIDEVIAVHIDGLPCKEFTASGEGASLFLTGEGRVTQPQEIFNMSGNSELGLAWMKKYPKYTHSNLEKMGTMFLTGAPYYFVNGDHPVLDMLRANEDQLGVQVSQESAVEGGWFKVEVEAFLFCVQSIRNNILQNTPSTFNLNNLTVRISKPDGQRWVHLRPELIETLICEEIKESGDPNVIIEARRIGCQRYIDKPLHVTLRIAFEYALPDTVTLQSTSAISSNNTNNNNNNNNHSKAPPPPPPLHIHNASSGASVKNF